MRHWSWIVAVTLVAAGAGSQAQGVYRCGNSYGPQPCEGGSTVAAPHLPSRDEAARAARAAKVDAQRAAALEQARLARERSAPRAVVMGPKQAASAARPAPPLRRPEQFKSTAPAPAKQRP